jgi:hypothetical protein
VLIYIYGSRDYFYLQRTYMPWILKFIYNALPVTEKVATKEHHKKNLQKVTDLDHHESQDENCTIIEKYSLLPTVTD